MVVQLCCVGGKATQASCGHTSKPCPTLPTSVSHALDVLISICLISVSITQLVLNVGERNKLLQTDPSNLSVYVLAAGIDFLEKLEFLAFRENHGDYYHLLRTCQVAY